MLNQLSVTILLSSIMPSLSSQWRPSFRSPLRRLLLYQFSETKNSEESLSLTTDSNKALYKDSADLKNKACLTYQNKRHIFEIMKVSLPSFVSLLLLF